ncbi:hypothetical protein [Streptomyces sp. DT171]|uniref:hypothetical protein n=1 Tax=Streptomyces sp. DT171 TaxID=3416524 RepID=UPI003CF23173
MLVVDVPPSEMAPHFQYGWEAKGKDRVAFNAPHRINDHSFYMPEHQVARAYRERFARQDAADALLQAWPGLSPIVGRATDSQPGRRRRARLERSATSAAKRWGGWRPWARGSLLWVRQPLT